MRRVDVFFYGSFIDPAILEAAGVEVRDHRKARLPGWEITIGALANIAPREGEEVHGAVVGCTHAELDRLYGQEFVRSYRPEAVLVEADGGTLPALTYVSGDAPAGRPEPSYVEKIVSAGTALGFPDGYLRHIRSFI